MNINNLSLADIIEHALQSRKGTLKVTAALGGLLAADAMINLCSFVNFWERYREAERRHISAVDHRVFETVSRAWIEFDGGPDDVAASRQAGVFARRVREGSARWGGLLRRRRAS
ncbi:MAG: hypothetical protein HOW73_46505 [Polyangiaceae bacterium]|nr:hypothetical protein [Polyangiaceae bacterium]